MQHTTVLLKEAVDGLALDPTNTVVDATFGAGGHARAICERLDNTGCYIGIDADASALQTEVLAGVAPKVHLVHDNFSNLKNIISSLHIEAVDRIIADLGWRLDQFTDSARGFSFMHDGPLHMTYGDPSTYAYTAADIVNEWEEHVIADILFGYAEERFARRIARAIVESRQTARIDTTAQLVAVVEKALPKVARRGKIHPATKTFQALRIAVNDELGVLKQFIEESVASLTSTGRLAIISFHSIEDRLVKHSFRALHEADVATVVTKKPIVPSRDELAENPRSRSAKLRIIIKK